MTSARGGGLLLILLWAVAAIAGFFFGGLSFVILPGVALLGGSLVGVPLYIVTWLWIRRTVTRGEQRVLGVVGAVWLLLIVGFGLLMLGVVLPFLGGLYAVAAYSYFPFFAALIALVVVVHHWRSLPAQPALAEGGSV
jgi:hypothetical protein